MAGPAGSIERFVGDEFQSACRNLLCLVTGHTRHLGMCTVEYKSRITLMIKFGRFPVIRRVALVAVGYTSAAGNDELAAMHILMATRTGGF